MRDIRKLNDSYAGLSLSKVAENTFIDSRNRKQPQYQLSKMQTMDLMTGYSEVLRIKVNRRWEEAWRRENVRILDDNYENMGLPKVGEGYYTLPNTVTQQHRECLPTKIQTFDLMTEVISPHRTVPDDRQDFHQGRI